MSLEQIVVFLIAGGGIVLAPWYCFLTRKKTGGQAAIRTALLIVFIAGVWLMSMAAAGVIERWHGGRGLLSDAILGLFVSGFWLFLASAATIVVGNIVVILPRGSTLFRSE